MKTNYRSKYIAWILCLCTVLASIRGITVKATDGQGASGWHFTLKELMHTVVTFELSSVEHPGKAMLIVESQDSDKISDDFEMTHLEIPFSVTKPQAEITLDFPDGKYLSGPNGTSYNVWIKDSEGNETRKESRKLSCEPPTFYAYRKCIYIYNTGNTNKHVNVTAGFAELKEYDTNALAGTEKTIFDYDEQELGSIVNIKWNDDYGCLGEEKVYVKDEDSYYFHREWQSMCPYDNIRVYKDCLVAKNLGLGQERKIGIEVEGKVYYSEYAAETVGGTYSPFTKIVDFPQVDAATTDVNVWLEGRSGTKSRVYPFSVKECYLNDCIGSCTAKAAYATGKVDNSKIAYSAITAVKTVIDEKEYSCDVAADGSFTLTYPKRNHDDKLTLVYVDKHGCTYEDYVSVDDRQYAFPSAHPTEDENPYNTPDYEDQEPWLDFDTVYASDKKITGTTEKNSSVIVKIGKKIYTGKSNANGKFSIKVKPSAPYTNVVVSVVTPSGKKASDDSVVQIDNGGITIKTLYKNKKKVKVKITHLHKGDKVVLKVGNKKYKKKAKRSTETFKIKKASSGTKLKAYLYDKYGYRKDKDSDIIYSAKTIKKGMTERDALYTKKWGKPTRKDKSGSRKEWLFEKGETYIWVHIKKGKITDIDMYNY